MKEFSDYRDFLFAANEAGFVVYSRVGLEYTGDAFLALNERDEVVGHFFREATGGVVTVSDGVLAPSREEYLAYEG